MPINGYSSFNDPTQPRTKTKRYDFKRMHCSFCGRMRWVSRENLCGACWEDEDRLMVERNNAIAQKWAERNKKK